MVTNGRIMGEISLSLRKSLNATFSRKFSFICKPTPRDENSPSLSSRTLYIPHFLVFICFYLVFLVICGSLCPYCRILWAIWGQGTRRIHFCNHCQHIFRAWQFDWKILSIIWMHFSLTVVTQLFVKRWTLMSYMWVILSSPFFLGLQSHQFGSLSTPNYFPLNILHASWFYFLKHQSFPPCTCTGLAKKSIQVFPRVYGKTQMNFLTKALYGRAHTDTSHIHLLHGQVFLSLQCMHAKSLGHVWLFLTLWTVDHPALQSMGFSRQGY